MPQHRDQAAHLLPTPCGRCGVDDVPRLVSMPPGSVHAIRAECAHCGRFVRWLPKPKGDEERAAQHEKARKYGPATTQQMALLERLGYDGPPPMSIQEASDLIQQLLAKKE